MARVLDSVTLPIKKNGTKTNQNYVNNPKSTAGQFSTSTAYAVGQYVYYDKKLYRFTTAHAAGAWNASHVTEVTVTSELTSLKAETNDLKQDLEGLDVYTLGLYPQMSVADTAVASFTDGADDIPVKSLTVDITPVQSGSGDPSPSNDRPISGWTGANVKVSDFNQFDGEWVEDTGYNVAKNYMPVIPGETYYIYAPNIPSGERVYANTYDSNKTLVGSSVSIGRVGAYVIPDNVYYMKLRCWGAFDYTNLCFNISDPAKNGTYEPYKGNVYSITFPTSAGTVYGGTLDVTNGVLTVTNGYVDLGTLDWVKEATSSGNWRFYASFATHKKYGTGERGNMICSKYATITANQTWQGTEGVSGNGNSNSICVCDMSYSDATAIKTSLSGVQFVYELATPVTYQLNQREVTTLLRNNNIFADTGNVAELTYRADLKAYIDEKLA